MPQRPTRSAFQTLALALAIFGMAAALVLTLIPRLFAGLGTPQPPFVLFLLAGLAVIALTVALFAAMGYLGLGFDKSTLVLAAGYNVLIAGVKFVFAPTAMYITNREDPSKTSWANPTPFSTMLWLPRRYCSFISPSSRSATTGRIRGSTRPEGRKLTMGAVRKMGFIPELRERPLRRRPRSLAAADHQAPAQS